MRATAALQKCLHEALDRMHALRVRGLPQATLVLIAGHRLTLMDVARSWPGVGRVRALLKALGRLLGNRHLPVGHERIYAITPAATPRPG